MKDPVLLAATQDTVWNYPVYKADKWPDGTPRTHCNQAALAVANGVGCKEIDPPEGGELFTADQLYFILQRASVNFSQIEIEYCQDYANQGTLIFAISPSWLLGESHGHIVSITPGKTVLSEVMRGPVPVCMNISTAAFSSRLIGINWAFPLKKSVPHFFAWKESL